MIKFKFGVIVLIAFNSICAFSQLGVKVGGGMSTMVDGNYYQYRGLGTIGITYETPISKQFVFQPELLFTNIGTSLKDDGFFLKSGYVDLYGVEIPLNFSYRPLIGNGYKLLIDAGPYVFYGLFGNKKYEYYDQSTVEGNPFDAYNRFNVGINLGIGLQLPSKYYGTINFQQGLSHITKDNNKYIRTFRLMLGYRF